MVVKIQETISSVTEVPIAEHNVQRVNSIKKLYPAWRQESKAPTFALTL